MRRDPRATANSFRAGGAKLAATNARASNAAACHSAASDEYRARVRLDARLPRVQRLHRRVALVEEDAHQDVSGLISELLERQRGGLVAVREVSARAYGVVKRVGLAKESRVARAKVKVVVQLADARGDLPDLPSLEPSLGQGIAVVLLELPQPSERLERLRTSDGERARGRLTSSALFSAGKTSNFQTSNRDRRAGLERTRDGDGRRRRRRLSDERERFGERT